MASSPLRILCPVIAAVAIAVPPLCVGASAFSRPTIDPWILAYYLSADQSNGRMPLDKIDFRAITHLIHFDIVPNANGVIDPAICGITAEQSRTVISTAHAAGCRVIVGLGSDEGTVKLRKALTPTLRAAFVQSLVRFVTNRGYDGIDVDFEPLQDSDIPTYEPFIRELRTALVAAKPGCLLTAAVATEPALFARLQNAFDRIDLMTYDLSGPWPGFESWYNAGLYDKGRRFDPGGDAITSVEGMVNQFVTAGVAGSKLGIGIAFYGYLWTGASGPNQSQAGVKVDDDVDYNKIMDQYYRPNRYHWDRNAHAPYLSIDAPDWKARGFLSYDDERLCVDKIRYVRKRGLGGVIIWELGGGFRANQPPGKQDVLIQAIRRARGRPHKP